MSASDIGWWLAAGAVFLVLLLALRAEAAPQDQQEDPKCPCGGCQPQPGQHNEPLNPRHVRRLP